ncbi:MAG: RNA polymerase subunit sigma-70 [Bacteroidetes bacterium HGW-Bacteroidetes-21]|jgi:RNA polymerase sigma-70 factor (ECF subfamily)|nr:MAG: RNA polymerase subunit sigma-70 [Bacteroidetes bacterium HGW-Bacteroidetes-21]
MKVTIGDKEIVNGCRKQDKESFRWLFKKHSPWMLGICLRYCQNRNDAQDVLQECLVKVFKSIDNFQYQSDAQFVSWLKRIVVNTSLNYLRDKAKDKFISMDDSDMHLNISEEETNYDQQEPATQEYLLELINKMPAGYRAVFNMYVFEKMTHKEIATELNISENTSKTQLLKARNFLKNKISESVKTLSI